MRRSIYGFATAVLMTSSSLTSAEESTGVYKIKAATHILAYLMLVGGVYSVESEEKVTIKNLENSKAGSAAVVEKINDCVYAIVISKPNEERHYAIINFAKLYGD